MFYRLPLFFFALVLAAVVSVLPSRAEEPFRWQDYTIWRDLPPTYSPAPMPESLDGRTVLLRWNGKHNSDQLLQRLQNHLQKRFPAARVTLLHQTQPGLCRVSRDKNDADELVTALAAFEPAVVITATGDCRVCAAWLAVEQVLLERRGIPTISLLTHPFNRTFQAVRQNLRMDVIPCVIVPHPVANIATAKVLDKADKAANEVAECLQGGQKRR